MTLFVPKRRSPYHKCVFPRNLLKYSQSMMTRYFFSSQPKGSSWDCPKCGRVWVVRGHYSPIWMRAGIWRTWLHRQRVKAMEQNNKEKDEESQSD